MRFPGHAGAWPGNFARLQQKEKTMFQKMKSKLVAGATAASTAVMAGAASAQASFDTTDILADVATYSAAALAVIAAILLARWGIHATGLLRPRG